jgi:hypothetical protein
MEGQVGKSGATEGRRHFPPLQIFLSFIGRMASIPLFGGDLAADSIRSMGPKSPARIKTLDFSPSLEFLVIRRRTIDRYRRILRGASYSRF